MPDLRVLDQGTVVLFTPVSERGREWLEANCATESWQWLGSSLGIDHRMAGPVIEGAINDGLEVALS